MTNFENIDIRENIEQVTDAVEEIVPTNGPKFKPGKTALIATVVTAAVIGCIALVKKHSKKAKEEEPETEEPLEAEYRDVSDEDGEDE